MITHPSNHVILFFEEAILASLARKFGSALLTKGASSVNLRDFKCAE